MLGTYPPLNTLKEVAEDVWIADGPIIRFGAPWPKMPFPTRMTVIRLAQGKLLIHSPTQPTEALREEIAAIGTPRWIIGPNRLHYWWIPQWRAAYPAADVFLAPGIRAQARGRIDFAAKEIAGESGYPWDAEIATIAAGGGYLTEFDFFHRRSRTLVLADLIENFEPDKLGCGWLRLMTRLGGVQDPDGAMPRDLRWTFRRQRAALRRAVETMIAWQPERVIIAHGRWYERDGAAELRRAFRWLLERG
jgi:hypothetical protein